MKLSQDYYLKWLDCNNPALDMADYSFTQLVLLFAKNQFNQIIGFTVFEPRDLNESFVKRMEDRKARSDFSQVEFFICAPPFLEHRVQTLLSKTSLKNIEIFYTPFVHVKKENGFFNLRKSLRVVSVDDSPVLLKFLKKAMDELGYIDVIAQISNSEEAVGIIQKLKPDLVTLDIQMPKKTGVEVLKDLLSHEYYPVLMISSLSLEEGSLVIEALNGGAFDYIQKPRLEDLHLFKEDLSQKSLMAVEGRGKHTALKKSNSKNEPSLHHHKTNFNSNLIWCLGSSTGGTQALTHVFTSLPTHIPPTLIVQHIPPVFSKAFAKSLNDLCPFTVKEAEQGEPILSDYVYIAPGGIHMGVDRLKGNLCIVLKDSEPINRFKPSVDFLFSTVAKQKQLQVVAGILTGMGRDGAEGLLELKKQGAQTFAQDEASSAVYGMPRVAFEIGATDKVVSLDSMASTLLELSFVSSKRVA